MSAESSGTSFVHIPVLHREVVEMMQMPADRSARLVDCTVGGGGHSSLLLEKYPKLELLGIDRDYDALNAAAERLSFARSRVMLMHGSFSEFPRLLRECGWDKVDGMLFDLGVSSPQLDRAERGFAWRMEGPLDMRMNQDAELTAGRLLNRASAAELTRIFREYGEINGAGKLAAKIVEVRETKPFGQVSDLVELCDSVLKRSRPGAPPVPTLVFQALRIAVNDELGELENALANVPEFLAPGGRVGVISFHSLEDRIVKNFFRFESTGCICPPGLPVCRCGHLPRLQTLTRKPLVPQADEIAENRRSACSKLRVAERLA